MCIHGRTKRTIYAVHVLCKIRGKDKQHEKHCVLDVLLTFCSGVNRKPKGKINRAGGLRLLDTTLSLLFSLSTLRLLTGSALWISGQLTRPTVEPGSKVQRRAGLKGLSKREQPADALSLTPKNEIVWL